MVGSILSCPKGASKLVCAGIGLATGLVGAGAMGAVGGLAKAFGVNAVIAEGLATFASGTATNAAGQFLTTGHVDLGQAVRAGAIQTAVWGGTRAVGAAWSRARSAATETTPLASAARSCSFNSFTADTPVLLANGRRIPIDKVKPGMKVVATDPTTKTTASRKVDAVIVHGGNHTMVNLSFADGSRITATDRHPFWNATTRRFAYASALKAGDQVREADGGLLTITKTRTYTADVTAYNLTIDDIHTYYAGTTPVLVHNSCGGGEVLDETLEGAANRVGNQTSAHHLTESEALDTADAFLGPAYREGAGQSGNGSESGVYWADQPSGQRYVFRMDGRSLDGLHAPGIPHVHFEVWDGRQVLINNHVEVTPE